MRTRNSILNIFFTCLCYLLIVVSNFFMKPIFVQCLGTEYDGIEFTFSNFIYFLEIVEIGLGMSMIYKLYDPISKNDFVRVSFILRFLKKSYFVIMCLIVTLGIPCSIFAVKTIGGSFSKSWLFFIFYLHLLDLICSYLYFYKSIMIIADQRFRVIGMIRSVCIFFLFFIQFFVLRFYKSLELFLVAKIISKISESLGVSYYFNKKYKGLVDMKNLPPMDKEKKKDVIDNIKALFFHRVGGMSLRQISGFIVILFSTLTVRSLYNRYMLVVISLLGISMECFQGIMASFGNLLHSESKEKVEKNLNTIVFLNFLIYSLFCTVFFSFSESFMKFWIPDQLHFDFFTTLAFTIYLYSYGMRQGIEMVKSAAGIYIQGKYFPLLECALNFVLSYFLASKIGIIGAIIGNIVSCMSVPFFSCSYLLYKIVFNKRPFEYYKKYIIYTIVTFFEVFLGYYASKLYTFESFFVQSVVNAFICLIISISINIIVFCKMEEFIHLKNIFKEVFYKLKSKLSFDIFLF